MLKPSRKIETKEAALSSAVPRQQHFATLYPGLALAAVTFLVYAPSGRFGFVNLDDGDYVFNNTHVSSGLKWDNIVWAFSGGARCNWHPLTWISHMADCQLFGMNPGPPHLINALLHSANAWLLFLMLFRMTGLIWRSLVVAALFAFHPLHVESVAWISERKDVLSTFFWFLTLLAYHSYTRQRNLRRYALVALFFTLGLMSKPMLVTLPCVLLLLDYWPLNRLRSLADLWRLLMEKLPLFALSAVSCFITLQVQKTGGAVISLEQLPLVPRLENALLSYGRYLVKTFWPDRLAIPLPFENVYARHTAVLLAGIALVVLTIATIWLGKRHKFFPVGWFWYLGTLVPVIGIVQVGCQSAADRYTYIPSVGIFLLVIWGLAEAFQRGHIRRSLITALAVTIVSLCAALSSHQIGFWRNSITLFKHTLAVNPENMDAQNALAWSYATDLNPGLRNGPEALRLALHCAEVSHRMDWVYLDTLAAAYAECGQFQSAVQTQEEVFALPVASELPAEAISDLKSHLELYQSGKAVNAR